jgi:hypothetical protein
VYGFLHIVTLSGSVDALVSFTQAKTEGHIEKETIHSWHSLYPAYEGTVQHCQLIVCVFTGPWKKKVPAHSLTGILMVKMILVPGARFPTAGAKPTLPKFAKAVQWSVAWFLALEITAAWQIKTVAVRLQSKCPTMLMDAGATSRMEAAGGEGGVGADGGASIGAGEGVGAAVGVGGFVGVGRRVAVGAGRFWLLAVGELPQAASNRMRRTHQQMTANLLVACILWASERPALPMGSWENRITVLLIREKGKDTLLREEETNGRFQQWTSEVPV